MEVCHELFECDVSYDDLNSSTGVKVEFGGSFRDCMRLSHEVVSYDDLNSTVIVQKVRYSGMPKSYV